MKITFYIEINDQKRLFSITYPIFWLTTDNICGVARCICGRLTVLSEHVVICWPKLLIRQTVSNVHGIIFMQNGHLTETLV